MPRLVCFSRVRVLFVVQFVSDANPVQFSQMFQLVSLTPGQYHPNNDSRRIMHD